MTVQQTTLNYCKQGEGATRVPMTVDGPKFQKALEWQCPQEGICDIGKEKAMGSRMETPR